jgi:hypothetical protein
VTIHEDRGWCSPWRTLFEQVSVETKLDSTHLEAISVQLIGHSPDQRPSSGEQAVGEATHLR